VATKLEADTSPIVVDGHNSSSGTTTIHYEKNPLEELWVIRTTGTHWNQPNLHQLTGLGDEALFGGAYPITLQPGDHYIVSVYHPNQGPLTLEPSLVTTLDVSCLWKDPGPTRLITHESSSWGGTWHTHPVFTGSVPTRIVMVGVSREPPSFDSNGIPRLTSHDGEPTRPLKTATIHEVEIKPLCPGNHYFFVVLVTDAFGNWDFVQREFTTLRRKITVEFPTIHIYNDGDYATVGEAEFWFWVFRGTVNNPNLIEEFHYPQQDIDDWSETDRPYAS
jgi:hypothetical protein